MNGSVDESIDLRRYDNCLLLAVTGGIATGKTTVATMLETLGARTIDFDTLAREVVEPGKPAWTQIVDCFGKQILREDGRLDRKKVSEIVFKDGEKRKKLEGFTHPRIIEAFIEQLDRIVKSEPDAIVQVIMPLLIEANFQFIFYKILLVYVPQEKQIERLVKRDGIGREEGWDRLKAQMPIDEKLRYADFVIYNDKSVEETRRQVSGLWQILKDIQREKRSISFSPNRDAPQKPF